METDEPREASNPKLNAPTQVKSVPHPRIVEMRLRAWEVLRHALKARDPRQADRIIDEWLAGKITKKEAITKLKKLASNKKPPRKGRRGRR